MANFCGKCGSEIDKKTGLCPKCDADALEKLQEVNAKKSLKKAKCRGITAIIALVLVVAMIASAIILAVSKGWIGESTKDTEQKIQSTYVTYLTENIIPEIGAYDSEHPESSNEGVHSALFCDLNNDSNKEFIVAYSEKNENNIDFNISCYTYQDDSNALEDHNTNGNGVDLIGTANVVSQVDYTEDKNTENHLSNEIIVYSALYNEQTYIIVEYLNDTTNASCSYECHVYTMNNGIFVEVGNLFVQKIATPIFDTAVPVALYSTILPEGMSIDNSDFDYGVINNIIDMGENWQEQFDTLTDENIPILYFLDVCFSYPEYQYDTYYSSQNDAVAGFFDCYGITKQDGFISIGSDINTYPYFWLNYPSENLIFSYKYYKENSNNVGDENAISEKYEINDYTDWKSLISEDDSKQAAETDEIDIEKVISDAGIFAWNWFYDNSHTDKSNTITKHVTADWGEYDTVFEPITEKSIKSKNDLVNLTNQYFTKSVTEELMNYKQWYEENNQLYVSQTDGLGDPLIDEYDIFVQKDNDSKYTLKVVSYFNGKTEPPYEVSLELINGNWVLNDIFAFYSVPQINIIDENSKDYNKYQQYFSYLDKLENEYSQPYSYYSLYDIDNNGVLELIAVQENSEAEIKYDFYTYDNGMVSLGNAAAGHSALLISKEDNKGLYQFYSHMDYCTLAQITLNNQHISTDIIREGQAASETAANYDYLEYNYLLTDGYTDTFDPAIYDDLRIVLK